MHITQLRGSLLLLVVFACAKVLPCQEASCDQVRSMARMARARSVAVLSAERKRAGDSYRARIVFAGRVFELNPTDGRAAGSLLSLIPQDGADRTALMTLGDKLCDSESDSDITSLARLRDALPADLSGAVLLVPAKMAAYVAYSTVAVTDPHSDYAVQMQRVCREAHAGFRQAVGTLPANEREWFAGHVLDPKGCRAVALPEAE